MNGFRDVELLSSYLDGQLSPSDSARLESRLKSDQELASVFNDLRAARSILRKLPARKAPRNFTLTRKMVGVKPPMPRTYSFFRFSSAFATLLLVITFAFNAVSSISFGAGAPAYGSGGGGPDIAFQAAAATEAPATQAPAMPEEPSMEMAPLPTQGLPPVAADSGREVMETPAAEDANPKDVVPTTTISQDDQNVLQDKPSSFATYWKIGLLLISVICATVAFIMNRFARRKWR